MAQNITLMGASYSDVPSVLLPKTGGGNATFTDTSPTTASASDVAQGKIFFDSTGSQQTGTASGGGGASNVVTGTFTGTTTGAAMDITLNYSGSGYPVALVVYPKDGANNTNSTIYSLVQRYACLTFSAFKSYTSSTPTYSSGQSENTVLAINRYKNSSTSATNYQNNATNGVNAYRDTDASDGASNIVKIKSATKLSVYIASTSYGFAANIEYTYWVLYSS